MFRSRVIVMVVLASVLVACGASNQSPGGSAGSSEAPQIPEAPQQFLDLIAATKKADKDYGGATVSVVVDSIQSGYPFFWLAPAIEKALNIKLKVIAVPFETYYQSIQNDIVSNTGAYDIVSYPPRFLGDLASAGSIVDLTDFAAQWDPQMDDVYPVYQLYTKFDDKLFALPIDGDRLELYYRKDLFGNADEQAAFQTQFGYALAPPQTWDQYLDVAKFFKRDTGATLAGETLTQPFSGMAEITKLPDNFDWFLNRFASYGGIYFDDQMHPQLNTDAGKKALQNFVDSVKFGPSDILNFEYVESFDAFVQGQVAMCIQWTDVAKIAEDPNTSKIVGKTGYAQVPGVEQPDGTVLHRSTLAYNRVNSISKLAKNQGGRLPRHPVHEPAGGEPAVRHRAECGHGPVPNLPLRGPLEVGPAVARASRVHRQQQAEPDQRLSRAHDAGRESLQRVARDPHRPSSGRSGIGRGCAQERHDRMGRDHR